MTTATSTKEPASEAPYAARKLDRPRDVGSNLEWSYVIAFTVFHAALVLLAVPWLFSWTGVVLLVVSHMVFDWLGIGLCFHRTLTHGGLVMPKWLERTFATFGVFTLMDSPARWVAVHRKHHQHSDEQEDPHSPLVRFAWGHMEWLVRKNDGMAKADFYHKYAKDILRDPYYLWLEKGAMWWFVYLAHTLVYFAAGFAVGCFNGGVSEGLRFGASLFLWGAIYRTIFTWHVTWAVNSVCHMWGYRNYETRDNSYNSWWVALVTGGEGWHNNHHAHPVSAAHGHRWWEIDATYTAICCLEWLGLAEQVKLVEESPTDELPTGPSV